MVTTYFLIFFQEKREREEWLKKRDDQNDDDEEQMMMGVYGEGDTLACVQQYVSWLLPPSDFDQAKDRAREGLNSLPEARLTIDHVYGYRYVGLRVCVCAYMYLCVCAFDVICLRRA